MDDYSSIANTPFEVGLGSNTITVAALSVGDLFGKVGEVVKSDMMSDARKMCHGLAPEVQAAMLAAAWEKLPSGDALMEAIQNKLASFDGIILVLELASMQAGKPVVREALRKMITPDACKELAPIVNRLCGLESGDEPEKKAQPES